MSRPANRFRRRISSKIEAILMKLGRAPTTQEM
jgi:hypothetical protein